MSLPSETLKSKNESLLSYSKLIGLTVLMGLSSVKKNRDLDQRNSTLVTNGKMVRTKAPRTVSL